MKKNQEIATTVARRARIALTMNHMTSADLMRATTLGSGTISALLNAKRDTGISTLVRLANALGVSIDWLTGLSEQPMREKRA
jgi:transcriptional regulator with XRE-family HTH domain